MSNNRVAKTRDEDSGKGAVEQDRPGEKTNTSLGGQIGHRDQDALLKSSDSDFPERGQNPEHSGEPQGNNQLSRDTEINCENRAPSRKQETKSQPGKK